MIISCIGDSLTEGDYGVFGKRGIANKHKENYPFFLAELLEAEVRNFGKCGCRSSMIVDRYKDGKIDVKCSDVIIIMLGTNGGQHPTDMTVKENAAYKELVELCKKDAPEAKIVLCTPPHATEDPEFSNCGYAPQVNDAVDFVRLFAKTEGLPLIDVAACPEFTAENEHIYQSNDGLHFVEAGYKALAKFIAENLKSII